jgi:large subunit ribosomal protein L23
MPANIDSYSIIKKPLLTEKSTFAMNEQKRYAFVVDKRATKTEIKKAVEEVYNVKVDGIWTSIKKYPNKQIKFGLLKGTEVKKATVTLKGGATIELF